MTWVPGPMVTGPSLDQSKICLKVRAALVYRDRGPVREFTRCAVDRGPWRHVSKLFKKWEKNFVWVDF